MPWILTAGAVVVLLLGAVVTLTLVLLSEADEQLIDAADLQAD